MAAALLIEHTDRVRRVLLWWAAGLHLANGNEDAATRVLVTARKSNLQKFVAKLLPLDDPLATCRELQGTFPLNAEDAAAIEHTIEEPEGLAQALVERFSPKWFMGWRDICRATDERTLIASAVPRVAVGHKFQLMFSLANRELRLPLLANLNSVVLYYVARQKLGGTSFSYFVMRQLPILPPTMLACRAFDHGSQAEFLRTRTLELTGTANDVVSLLYDASEAGSPFPWDEVRRFEIRCERDAAMFHLYLAAESDGHWRRADGETDEQLAAHNPHFLPGQRTSPRAAADHDTVQYTLGPTAEVPVLSGRAASAGRAPPSRIGDRGGCSWSLVGPLEDPRENLDDIVPCLLQAADRYGPPDRLLHDLSPTMSGACEQALPGVSHFVCHQHLAGTVGPGGFAGRPIRRSDLGRHAWP